MTHQPQKASIFPVFPIYMLHGELEADHHKVAESCRRAVAKVKRRRKGNTAMDYTTYFDGDIREEMQKESWFIDMTNKLKDTYIDYINATYGCRVAHLSRHDVHFFCWVNVYNKAHHHEMHNHVNSYVSGTYYVKTDSDSQPIKFVSPNAMMDFGLQTVANPSPPKNYMPQNTCILGSGMHESELMFHPQCGEFLMWPSAMFHSVPPITDFNELPDDYERISISFNLDHARENLECKELGDQFHYSTVHKEEDPWDNRSQ